MKTVINSLQVIITAYLSYIILRKNTKNKFLRQTRNLRTTKQNLQGTFERFVFLSVKFQPQYEISKPNFPKRWFYSFNNFQPKYKLNFCCSILFHSLGNIVVYCREILSKNWAIDQKLSRVLILPELIDFPSKKIWAKNWILPIVSTFCQKIVEHNVNIKKTIKTRVHEIKALGKMFKNEYGNSEASVKNTSSTWSF